MKDTNSKHLKENITMGGSSNSVSTANIPDTLVTLQGRSILGGKRKKRRVLRRSFKSFINPK